jgi:hypothetical protein
MDLRNPVNGKDILVRPPNPESKVLRRSELHASLEGRIRPIKLTPGRGRHMRTSINEDPL